jgi:hypothetical protein
VGVEKLWGEGYAGGSLSFGVGTPVEVHAELDERTWKLFGRIRDVVELVLRRPADFKLTVEQSARTDFDRPAAR